MQLRPFPLVNSEKLRELFLGYVTEAMDGVFFGYRNVVRREKWYVLLCSTSMVTYIKKDFVSFAKFFCSYLAVYNTPVQPKNF